MNKNNTEKLSYAAWFIDGEGTIVITKRKNRRNPTQYQYSILLWVYQKDWEIMDWFVWNFWWIVYLKDRRSNPIYEWMLTHKKAYEFIKKVLPFLKYKKPQAELAIRFQERLSKTTRWADWRNMPLDSRELEIRSQMYEEMKWLKHIFKKSRIHELRNSAAVTTKCEHLEMGCDSLNSWEEQSWEESPKSLSRCE